MTSLLVRRGNDTLREAYVTGDRHTLRETQSVTKSVVALLMGIAYERGFLASLDTPVLSVLPALQNVAADHRWHDVTWRHLLTMTSGARSELTDPAFDDAWMASPDPLTFTLAAPLIADPGTTFEYTNGAVHLLGAALAAVVGEDLAQFAGTHLFTPLGITDFAWRRDPQGRPLAYGGLSLTTPDLARLGQLLLRQERPNAAQPIGPAWLAAMTSVQADASMYRWMEGLSHYGFLWWVGAEQTWDTWYATGYGGQYLAVVPALDLVVAVAGEVNDHPSHRDVITHVVSAVLAG